jgi:Conserved region in glutamate synthase
MIAAGVAKAHADVVLISGFDGGTGDPAHTVNFMRFIAQDLREIMAQLGFRTLNEMVGRTDILESKQAITSGRLRQRSLESQKHRPLQPALPVRSRRRSRPLSTNRPRSWT